MQNIRKLPIGIQDFEQIITSGFYYIDKTELIYNLVNDGNVFFLSRPRRFGKSLLITTLKAYFEGKCELFSSLAMEQLETEWIARPVIHINFAYGKFYSAEKLKSSINNILDQFEEIYGKKESEVEFNERLAGIIQRASEQSGEQIAVLIDEYDAPLLDVLNNEEEKVKIRNILRDLFSPLKAQGHYIKFLLLTGITKFSQLSIFSELNNLKNISMLPRYSAICGITEEEVLTNFVPEIEALALANNETYDQACAHLKQRYDGYHFSEKCPDIYNPFSLLNVLQDSKYANYWFSTGTPTFLIELMKEYEVSVDELENIPAKVDDFDRPTNDIESFIPVFYQSGYLTIKDFNPNRNTYILGFPNEEVRSGFVSCLVPYHAANLRKARTDFFIDYFVEDLYNGDAELFMTRLQSFFAHIPYDLNNKTEKHYQTIFYIFLTLLGQDIRVEHKIAIGRIDALVRVGEYLYIFEFKFNISSLNALQQIREKNYGLPYTVGNSKLIKVGASFNDETRTLSDWVIEE